MVPGTIIQGVTVWKNMEYVGTRKADKHCKWGLMGNPSKIMSCGSVESNTDCGARAHGVLEASNVSK